VKLPLPAFFQRPTVAQLAEYVETLRWTAAPAESLANSDYMVI
jgi:hypothetical protein